MNFIKRVRKEMISFIKLALTYLDGESGIINPYTTGGGARIGYTWTGTGWKKKPTAPTAPTPKPVSAIPEATAAMQVTQQRAAEDRAKALAEIRMGQQQAQQAMQSQQQQATAAWQTQQQQAMAAMQPWQQQVQALQAAPEAIGAPEAAQIFEAGRTPVEAGTQAMMRGMQEQYAPGGFRRGAMQQAMQSQIGQLGGMRQQIALERTLRRRQDLMSLMGQQAGYGQAMAGLGVQRAAGLSGIFGRTGAGMADIFGTGARSLAQIYGQTITAVPQMQGYATTPFQSPYPYRQG
ncbi:hypothetical protein LCGC14_0399390 [marine sediment metagenome]|uniref:Uncharacterized protein n=1 Tax=marine sediment metagenome TaxID=412755 RepID=A0A0F9W6F0_9ZZZZ